MNKLSKSEVIGVEQVRDEKGNSGLGKTMFLHEEGNDGKGIRNSIVIHPEMNEDGLKLDKYMNKLDEKTRKDPVTLLLIFKNLVTSVLSYKDKDSLLSSLHPSTILLHPVKGQPPTVSFAPHQPIISKTTPLSQSITSALTIPTVSILYYLHYLTLPSTLPLPLDIQLPSHKPTANIITQTLRSRESKLSLDNILVFLEGLKLEWSGGDNKDDDDNNSHHSYRSVTSSAPTLIDHYERADSDDGSDTPSIPEERIDDYIGHLYIHTLEYMLTLDRIDIVIDIINRIDGMIEGKEWEWLGKYKDIRERMEWRRLGVEDRVGKDGIGKIEGVGGSMYTLCIRAKEIVQKSSLPVLVSLVRRATKEPNIITPSTLNTIISNLTN